MRVITLQLTVFLVLCARVSAQYYPGGYFGDGTSGASPGAACTTSSECWNNNPCLGGRCCSFGSYEYECNDDMYGTCPSCNSWCQGYKSCTSCGDESYTDPRWGYPNPGQCNACGDNFRLLKGDEADNINQQSGMCAPVCGADQYLENSVCVAKKKAGEYCWDNHYYGPGYGPGGEEETKRDNPMCASGKCGGPSSNNYMMSMSPYCCADPTCEKPCDQGTGACTTKSMPGEACSTKDDCYGEHACLGGKCCSFTHSEYNQSYNDPYMYMYSYNNERITKCTACGGTDEKDRYGSDRPGQCVSCAAGYRLLTGKETDVNNGWDSGVCGPTCNSTTYLDAGMWPMQCVPKTDAGKYCWNPWPYWDPMTAPEEQQTDNFNTGGFMCKSGLCGGGGANSMSMSMSMSYCSYDPMTGYGGDQNYCCNDAAAAAGCKKPCDKTTGACTTKSMPGETCTSSADCFNDRACLGGRCCAFAACDHTAQAPPPPPPGGYDPYGYGGMYYYEDKQRYRYRSCNQCGDTKAKDHNGMERPGMCTSCGGDERLLIGDPKEESTYWDAGVCAPKCAEGEYFEGGMFECMAKSKAGEYCWSHYQWDPITGEASDIGGFMCASGVCGSTVKDPFFHMGYMMGNEYCCNADAVKEDNGQCCGRCKQGSGECLEWETCPAPPSEDMSAAQAAAGTIINSIKDEKQKKKAETLTAAAIAGDDIHKLAGKLKDSSGDAAIKSFYKNAAIDEKHGAAVATSLDAGWNQFLNPGGRRRLLAQYEFEVEVFFTETEVKDNSISLRTASTNLETAGVKGVTMQEDVDPIQELKTMGVESEKLENFEEKAKKSSAEVQAKRAIAPPPPSPPPRKLIMDEEDGAPSIRGGVVLSCVIALAATALFA